MLTIDNNIPLPTGTTRGPVKHEKRLILESLDAGQSVLFNPENPKNLTNIKSAVMLVKRDFPERFYVCRTVEDGFRVWRIS